MTLLSLRDVNVTNLVAFENSKKNAQVHRESSQLLRKKVLRFFNCNMVGGMVTRAPSSSLALISCAFARP